MKNLFSKKHPYDFLETLIHNAPVGISILDKIGRIDLCNKQFLDYLNIIKSPDEIINSNIFDYLSSLIQLKDIIEININNQTGNQKTEINLYENKYFTFSWQNSKVGYIITLEDITEQKIKENNSIISILEGTENERRRIGREIHDEIGPLLSFSKLSLDSFIQDIKVQYPNTNLETLLFVKESIDQATNSLKSLSHNLVPRILDEFGLISALENFISRFNKLKNLSIQFYYNIEKTFRFSEELELNLFRCCQELMNNSIKHAKATNIMVQVILHSNSLTLTVEDDGIGFDLNKSKSLNSGIGLTNVETRIRMLKGEFLIDSTKGKGTLATIEVIP